MAYHNILRGVSYLSRSKDYYKILELEPSCSDADIKAAFVRLTASLHPDTAPDAETELLWHRKSRTERFMDVKEAYDILRKPEKRRDYDRKRLLSQGYGGFLMEAGGARMKSMKFVDYQAARNALYIGPSRKTGDSGRHFINPEEEYEKERKKNRSFYLIGALFMCIIVANIGYVHYIRFSGRRDM